MLLYLATVILSIALGVSSNAAYLSDSWAMIAPEDRQGGSRCVPIPANLTICQKMQYKEMRIPNLLEHETLDEAIHHSADWNSLLNLNCHADTQLFLCSLFAPVCLPQMEKAIMPCRSLCNAVKEGCEARMQQYGFPWPEMLACSQYPEENDMCIKPMSSSSKAPNAPCESCTQVGTYENIIDHFCRSQLVIKARINIDGSLIHIRNGRSLKKGDRRRAVDEKSISLSTRGACPCELPVGSPPNQRYLIMATENDAGDYVASLILPWKKEKNFKRAVHQFTKTNCKTLGREIRASATRSRQQSGIYAMRKHNAPPLW